MTFLHSVVFSNDPGQVEKWVEKNSEDCNVRVNGLTALDLAIMLNRSECVRVLLPRSSCLGHNSGGWSPFNEVFLFLLQVGLITNLGNLNWK
jgi:ankyrin repeat protein